MNKITFKWVTRQNREDDRFEVAGYGTNGWLAKEGAIRWTQDHFSGGTVEFPALQDAVVSIELPALTHKTFILKDRPQEYDFIVNFPPSNVADETLSAITTITEPARVSFKKDDRGLIQTLADMVMAMNDVTVLLADETQHGCTSLMLLSKNKFSVVYGQEHITLVIDSGYAQYRNVAGEKGINSADQTKLATHADTSAYFVRAR
jgi:hypothetical protein